MDTCLSFPVPFQAVTGRPNRSVGHRKAEYFRLWEEALLQAMHSTKLEKASIPIPWLDGTDKL